MSGRGFVNTENTANVKHCYCRVSGRGSVNTEKYCQCKHCYCRVSGRGSVNTENTANVNTIIVECQVEVP